MPEVTNFENIVEGEILDEPEASVWDELTEEEKKSVIKKIVISIVLLIIVIIIGILL